MAEEPESLVPVYLRRIDGRQEKMELMLADHAQRLNRIELPTVRLLHNQAADAEGVALIQIQVDRMRAEIDRIERRLDLTD
jgi:hypothetical protein